ncbi:MAG: Endonuclease/exonuclease/phosphatase [Lentinula lateritia]|uniref:Endonuclease/exonuclease/phosphatase n=1 Tax=Lentinula lateritia TaxID=40482 RepID=A0ABQ8VQ75_9AGAR|nr:MAG: Endonuclease/exonuclease/phosphatase [Lentinula lateritia]KAJ4497595.1 Endonuclease/exonuclease/phosphatase [Lentinula lateritia]
MLDARIDGLDIILIEEPNWSFIGKEGDNAILGAVNHASAWTPISPIPAAPDSIHPRVYVYVKNGLHAEVTLWTDIVCDRDIMILDVTPRGGETTTYIHFYNDPSLGCQQILWRLRLLNLTYNHPVVLTGDANIHHIRWLRGVPRTTSITKEIVAWLDEHNFLILNKKGCPTHYPHDTGKHPSVIDLTWSNIHASHIDAICE